MFYLRQWRNGWKTSLVQMRAWSYGLSRLQRSQRNEEVFLQQIFRQRTLQNDRSFIESGQDAIQVQKS